MKGREYIAAVYSRPPRVRQDPDRDLTRDELHALTPSLVGLPICDNHQRGPTFLLHRQIPREHVHGRVMNAWHKAEDDGTTFVRFQLDTTPSAQALQRKIESKEYKHVSLSHEVYPDGRIQPLEISVCAKGARPDTYIVDASLSNRGSIKPLYGDILQAPIANTSAVNAKSSRMEATPTSSATTTPPAAATAPDQAPMDTSTTTALGAELMQKLTEEYKKKLAEAPGLHSAEMDQLRQQNAALKEERERFAKERDAATAKLVDTEARKFEARARKRGLDPAVVEKDLKEMKDAALKSPEALTVLQKVNGYLPRAPKKGKAPDAAAANHPDNIKAPPVSAQQQQKQLVQAVSRDFDNFAKNGAKLQTVDASMNPAGAMATSGVADQVPTPVRFVQSWLKSGKGMPAGSSIFEKDPRRNLTVTTRSE